MTGELSQKLKDLQALEAEIAELRRQSSGIDVEDFALQRSDGSSAALSELFGQQDHLIFVHNMGLACPYCTMWADGFNAMLPHIRERAAFVVASPDAPAALASGKAKRGWQFDMVSMNGTSLNRDLGFENGEGSPQPGVSTLIKAADGTIRRYSSDQFGPGDKYCSVWNLFALLPKGEPAVSAD